MMQDNIITETVAAPDLARLGRALERLHSLVAGAVFQQAATALHAGEMSFSQLAAMFRIHRTGPRTIAELAHGCDLTPTAASRMVERLVQGGLAERREVAGDRRQRRVDLTDAGRERLRFIVDSTASGYVELLSPAPPETLHRLAAVLDELRPFIANRRRLGASGGDGSDG